MPDGRSQSIFAPRAAKRETETRQKPSLKNNKKEGETCSEERARRGRHTQQPLEGGSWTCAWKRKPTERGENKESSKNNEKAKRKEEGKKEGKGEKKRKRKEKRRAKNKGLGGCTSKGSCERRKEEEKERDSLGACVLFSLPSISPAPVGLFLCFLCLIA
jgi:hypothetical protein